jgi:hypothetical protein
MDRAHLTAVLPATRQVVEIRTDIFDFQVPR